MMQVNIHTFSSFAHNILRQFAHVLNGLRNQSIQNTYCHVQLYTNFIVSGDFTLLDDSFQYHLVTQVSYLCSCWVHYLGYQLIENWTASTEHSPGWRISGKINI